MVGVSVQVSPVAGLMLEARLTTPLKLWIGAIVMVDVPAAPVFIVTLVGLAATVKSWTVYNTVAEWDRLLLVPVIVTE